jgi:hypothetical protein
MPTQRQVRTTTNLRLRAAPGLTYNTLSVIPNNTAITVFDELRHTDADQVWRYTITGQGVGWVAERYLTSGTTPTRGRYGLHIHQGSPREGETKDHIRDLARRGKLAGFVVINDLPFANELIQYCPYGVLRKVEGAYDPGPDYAGNSEDFGRGQRFFTNPFHWGLYATADPRLILQYANENNLSHDGWFYQGLMSAANDFGRKVVIFNDSVGATELTFDSNGQPHSEQWARRRDAMVFAIQHGHFVGMHTYGQIDAFFHPVSASDSPGAWPWYGGRFQYLYATMPDVQPPLLLTEKGPGKSELQRAMGFDTYWADHNAFETRIATLNYVKCYMDWTTGGYGAYGFEGDSLDEWLPLIAARL